MRPPGGAAKGCPPPTLPTAAGNLTGFGQSRKVADIVEQYWRLVERIKDVNLDALLLLTSALPRDRYAARRVVEVNSAIRDMATRDRVWYVDAWQRIAGADGQLRPESTMGRIHLTAQGYREWLVESRPALAHALGVGARWFPREAPLLIGPRW